VADPLFTQSTTSGHLSLESTSENPWVLRHTLFGTRRVCKIGKFCRSLELSSGQSFRIGQKASFPHTSHHLYYSLINIHFPYFLYLASPCRHLRSCQWRFENMASNPLSLLPSGSRVCVPSSCPGWACDCFD